MFKAAFAGITALLLTGCVTMSETECLATDWYERGVADGRAGHTRERIDSYQEACATVQVRPDVSLWQQGREAGLEDYCQLPLALERGLQRRGYKRVCSDPNYNRLYSSAKTLGDARHLIDQIDWKLSTRERELLDNKNLTKEQKQELKVEIRNLERQRDRARDDRNDAERRLDRLRNDLGV